MSRLACAWLVPALFTLHAFAGAKSSSLQADGTVDAGWLAAEIKQLRDNPPPNETLQRALLDGCQRAQELLQERAASLAEAKKYQTAFDEIPQKMEALQAAQASPAKEAPATSGNVPQPLAKIEDRIRQLDTALAAARNQLNELESSRQDRAARQIEIARQLAEGKSELENLSKSPEIAIAGESSDAQNLRRILKWARQAAMESKLQALAAELLYSQSSVELEALQISDASLRVGLIARQLAETRELIVKQRADIIRAAIVESEEKIRAITGMPEATQALKDLAERNLGLLRMESGTNTLPVRMDVAARELDAARAELSGLRIDFERMQKRVAAIESAGGRTDEALAQLLRERLGKLPPRTLTRSQSRTLSREISGALVELDNLQDERTGLGEDDSLPPGWDAGPSPQALALGRELLQTQRVYLDSLIASYGSYLQTLTELQVAQKNITAVSGEFSAFINERVLWIRSAPQWSLSNLGHRYEMFLRYWPLKGIAEVPRALGADLVTHWLVAFLGLGAFAVLQAFSPRMRDRSKQLAAKAATRMCATYLITLEAALYSLLLAVRWPLLLLFAGWRLSLVETVVDEQFVRCVGTSLMFAARSFLLLQFFRRVCRPKAGLGEAHLDWQSHNMQLVWRNLAWFIPLAIPLIFVVNVVERQGFEATAGQSIFLMNMVVLAVFAHFMLRPKKGIQILNSDDELVAPHQAGRVALYLTGIGLPILLLLAAYLGYYFSALEIAGRVRDSLWAAWYIYLASSLILRWFLVRQHRLVIHEAELRREAKRAGEEEAGHLPAPAAPVELAAIDRQTNRLLSVFFWISLLFTITYIWSETIPALKVLDSVRLWKVSVAAANSKAPAASPMPVLFGMASKSAETAAATPSGTEYVTLLDLLQVFLVLLITATASRNLPGLLKITFLNRLKLEQGVDHAAVTMVRYLVLLVGLITISNLLGLDWSKIQWIAAAFSLGIAFGLQELFANFISGLIILFERPIRLGDIISVGDITGTVTRINIRATRVTDPDRRDFLVPNKNFITGNVLNWTLSDPVTRVTLPVGVAYGSDTALAEKLLLEAASENPHIMKKPAPLAVLNEFGESTLNFRLYIFIPTRSTYHAMLHQLTTAIERKFREAGLNIAFPQRDVHLFGDKPIEVKVIGREKEEN
jgi:potassium efflux system protein